MRDLTKDTKEILNFVTKEACATEDTSELFLQALCQNERCYAAEILRRLNYIPTAAKASRRTQLSPDQVLHYADEVAHLSKYEKIDTQHILLALSAIKNCRAAELLRQANIETQALSQIVEGMSYHKIGKTESAGCAISGEVVLRLESCLSMRIIGQEEAIKTVCDRIKRVSAGLSNPQKPLATFLFTGSTGVGKTELCKALAEELYGKDALLRFDMSEYSDKSAITGLIGAPPAYIGYGEGGRLTEAVKKKPCAVVLFDEIEKAHRDVMNLLLQVLDEGELCDSRGERVNFKNCIIILTANALSYDIIKKNKAIGFDAARSGTEERELLKSIFPPEILGRVKVIRFHDLSAADYQKIVLKEVESLNKRLSDKKISVYLSQEALQWLAQDTGFGARGIRARVEETLEAELSEGILTGSFVSGSAIKVSYLKGEILLDIKTSEEAHYEN